MTMAGNATSPENIETIPDIDFLTEKLYLAHDGKVEQSILQVIDFLQTNPVEDSFEAFGDTFIEIEQAMAEKIEGLASTTDRETISLFRLRLKASAFTEEVLWRAIALSGQTDKSTQSFRMKLQKQLYGHYSNGLSYGLGPEKKSMTATTFRGAMQEATTLCLLSKQATSKGAVFISSYHDDKAKIDLVKYYLTKDSLRQENIQVKTIVNPNRARLGYEHVTIVDGRTTGNITDGEDGMPNYTWATAKALHADVFVPMPEELEQENTGVIKSALSNPTVRWINNLGK